MANSEHRDDKVLSVSTTPTGSPTFVDGPSSPTRSVHTEISSVSQVQHSDRDDSGRRQSDISDYPEGSTIGIKSPQGTIFGSTTANTPIDSQFGTPAGYSVLFDYPEGSPFRALPPQPPRRPSVDTKNTVAPSQTETHSPAVTGEGVAKFAAYPEGLINGIKSPKSPVDTVPSTATTQTTDTLASASTDAHAERSFNVPFLSKFLPITRKSHPATESFMFGSPQGPTKLRRSQHGYKRQVVEEQQQQEVKEASRQQELKEALAEGPPPGSQSFFDANSSDEEEPDADTAVIGAARIGSVKRPQLVEHRSSSLTKKDSTEPEADNPTPSKGKGARFLGTNIETLRALEGAPNQDPATSIPVAGHLGLASAPLPVLTENEPVGLGIQNPPHLNFQNGLRSHPIQRSQTVPSRPRRKVTFPPPPPLEEFKSEHRALRQSVVSTPYPVDGSRGRGMDVVVFLQLSGLRGRGRRIGSVVVPGRSKRGKRGDESAEAASGVSKGRNVGFDDRELFRLMRAEYRRRRGPLRVLAGARSLRRVRLRPDSSAVGRDGHGGSAPAPDEDDSATSARLTRLFSSPDTGKGKFDCVDFVSNTSNHDTVTFELVEDWSVTRIASAVVTVVVASLAATLLWVFLGTGGEKMRLWF